MLLYFYLIYYTHSNPSISNTSIIYTYLTSKFHPKNRPNTSTLPIYQ
nr:MAG TPA: hypothetical protein [Caudoviricetes sp.]